MKFNLNNPAFLQAGGNEPMITRMVLTGDSGGQVSLSANGLVIVEYMQDGEKVRNTYSALSHTYVPIPAGVEATVYGAVTVINYHSQGNVFTSLDVSKNTALTILNCPECTGLTSLDVSKNTALTSLNCGDCTGLTSLDVSKNTALTNLGCGQTGLTSLDVSKNTALTSLNCSGCTGLTSLDVSKNTALTILGCSYTELTSLDVSKNTALTILECNDCSQMGMLNVSNLTECANFGGMPNSDVLSTILVTGSPNMAIQSVMEQWFDSADTTTTGMLYVDENTQQSLIVAATDKGWTVEYVDAA